MENNGERREVWIGGRTDTTLKMRVADEKAEKGYVEIEEFIGQNLINSVTFPRDVLDVTVIQKVFQVFAISNGEPDEIVMKEVTKNKRKNGMEACSTRYNIYFGTLINPASLSTEEFVRLPLIDNANLSDLNNYGNPLVLYNNGCYDFVQNKRRDYVAKKNALGMITSIQKIVPERNKEDKLTNSKNTQDRARNPLATAF